MFCQNLHILFCYNKYWLMDVKDNTWHFCFGDKNFSRVDWQPKHITIGLFDAYETTWQVLAKNLTTLLDEYGFKNIYIACVKDEGANLNIMTMTL